MMATTFEVVAARMQALARQLVINTCLKGGGAVIYVASFVMCLAAIAYAEPPRRQVQIRVVDNFGAGVPGVAVDLAGRATSDKVQTVTDGSGLATGRVLSEHYSIDIATPKGFVPEAVTELWPEQKLVEVTLNRSASLEGRLEGDMANSSCEVQLHRIRIVRGLPVSSMVDSRKVFKNPEFLFEDLASGSYLVRAECSLGLIGLTALYPDVGEGEYSPAVRIQGGERLSLRLRLRQNSAGMVNVRLGMVNVASNEVAGCVGQIELRPAGIWSTGQKTSKTVEITDAGRCEAGLQAVEGKYTVHFLSAGQEVLAGEVEVKRFRQSTLDIRPFSTSDLTVTLEGDGDAILSGVNRLTLENRKQKVDGERLDGSTSARWSFVKVPSGTFRLRQNISTDSEVQLRELRCNGVATPPHRIVVLPDRRLDCFATIVRKNASLSLKIPDSLLGRRMIIVLVLSDSDYSITYSDSVTSQAQEFRSLPAGPSIVCGFVQSGSIDPSDPTVWDSIRQNGAKQVLRGGESVGVDLKLCAKSP